MRSVIFLIFTVKVHFFPISQQIEQSKFGGGTVVPPGESISVQRKAYCPRKKAST